MALALSACTANKKTTFYLLKSIEPSTSLTQNNNTEQKPRHIYLNTVKFPDYLDRPQMVLREDDYQLQFNEFHRWAEPLSDNFTQVLSENLTARLDPPYTVITDALHRTEASYQLLITVLRLDVSTDNQAVLKTKWRLLSKSDHVLIDYQTDQWRIPIKKTHYRSGVEAQSKAIALFTDQIAKAILALPKQQHLLIPNINNIIRKKAL